MLPFQVLTLYFPPSGHLHMLSRPPRTPSLAFRICANFLHLLRLGQVRSPVHGLAGPPLALKFLASQQGQGTEQLQRNKTGTELPTGWGWGEVWTVPWPAHHTLRFHSASPPGPSLGHPPRACALPGVGVRGLGRKEADSPRPQYPAATPRASSFFLSTSQFSF